MFKVNNKRHWRRSGFFIVNFEHISHLVLVFLLLTLSRSMPAGIKDYSFSMFAKFSQQEIRRNYGVLHSGGHPIFHRIIC